MSKIQLFLLFCGIKSIESSENKGSLVFVFDTTGSMHDDLAQLQEGAEMILNTALEESNGISNFVFVPFHDPKVGPVTVTTDKATFKAALASVRVHGGGDCPEKSITGLSLALNASLPRSFVYVFTDATAKDHRLVQQVLDVVQRKQSQVVFVLTGHCNDLHKPHYKAYQQIAAASSGQVFNLKKASVHKVLDFVRSSIKGRMVNLGSLVNPAGYNQTLEFPIDNTLGEVTVSVSGSKPQIRVVDPQGDEVTPPKLETTLDLSEIMVVKVHDPQPGRWTVTVGSEAQHSVKVVGMSNLTFHHGFSVEAPGSMDETSHRPLQGALNHMLISPTDSHPVVINSASILDLEGKVIFEVLLKKLNNRDYLTDAFLPPEDFFYVAINGYDEENQELRRIAPTAIKAKLPDAPYLVVQSQKSVKIHERVLLPCKIESLVPISAQWTKESERVVGPITSLQSTVIEYVIEDVGVQDAGTYRCSASNVAGITSSYTELTVLVDPPTINLTPTNITAMVGDEVTLQCNVFSDAILIDFRFLINETHATDIRIAPSINNFYNFNKTLKIDANDTGLYSCHAKNQGGITTKSTYINVLTHPKVHIIGPKTIETKINTSIELNCLIENALKSYWLSPNNTAIGVEDLNKSFKSILRLDNIELKHNGVWKCVGERNGLKGEDAINVKVTTKPQVSIESTKQIVQLYGTTLEIICTVIANPAPDNIFWRKANGDILSTMTSQTAQYTYTSLLNLNNVTEVDENLYFCYAENSDGSSMESVDVKIRKPMVVVEGLTNQSIELYSQIDMTCNMDAYPKPKITWYHNGTELQFNRNVHKSANNSTVYINKVDFDDFGVYECRAENDYEDVTLKGFLSVCCLEAPKLHKGAKTINVQIGRSIALSTSILKGNPYPDIKWQYKLNNITALLPKGVFISDDGFDVNISKVEMQHEGTYRCEAENRVGRDFYEVNLLVQYPPQIVNSATSIITLKVEVGNNLTLPCEATGVPKPFVTWNKDGEPVAYNKNVYLFNDSLVIIQAGEKDSGLFVCNATSPIGNTEKNYTVIIYEKPSISPPKLDTHIEILEGQLVELPCFARGLPKPKVKWLQNEQSIIEERKNIDNDFALRFVANLTDFGEYTCRASNEYGNTSLTYEVFVWVPPSIEGPQKITREVLIGNNVTLQCDAVGFPIPDVRWQFQDRKLIENTTELSFNDVGVLSIQNASSKHEGSYICVAENIVGVAEKVISLQVLEPPKILSENFTGPYIVSDMDTELRLPCRTRGRPTPFVAWSRDGRYIDIDFRYNISPEGTLVIKSLSEEMKGNYTCVAKNTVGEANRTIAVQIYALPMMTQADEESSKVTYVEGNEMKVDCPLRIGAGDTLKWYKDAELVATGDLVLKNALETESLSYACVVTNGLGSWQATVDIEVEYGPKFLEETKQKYEIVKGDDLVLDCRVRAKPKPQTTWYLNSKLLIGEDEEHFKLMNVQLSNTGMYRCVVRNTHGSVERLFTVDVLVPPFISDFDQLDVQLKEGTNATLECDAKGSPKPTVKWIYNNTNWHLTNNSLQTTNATVQASGTFQCVATNAAGRASLVYRVTVVAPARVAGVTMYDGEGVDVDDAVEVMQNKKIRLSCHATGNPIPNVRWIKNGNTLSQNEDGIYYADLTLVVRSTDSGVYSCIVSNEGGNDEKKFKLGVLEPPRISTSLFDNSDSNQTMKKLEVLSGQRFYLHCHPYGNPVPQIYWFKEGLPLKLYDSTMVTTDFGEIIVSDSASSGQSGNYTCVAVNTAGNTSFSYLLDVLVPPPSPKESNKTIRVRHGTSLNLTCPVQGVPPPDVLWVKHPYLELSENLSDRIVLKDGNSTLIMNSTVSTDSGQYTCHLVNKVGSAQITFNVSVENAPSIVGSDSNHTVNVGESVALYCDCDGEPRPTVMWYKDAKPLTQPNLETVLDNRMLTIRHVESRDATQFVCVAENTVGVAYKRFYLFVKVPGKWSSWGQWGFCNATCGPGFQTRGRSCRYTDDYVTIDKAANNTAANVILDESGCKGSTRDMRKCQMPPCEDDEQHWSPWSSWSACSCTCGVGTQTRTRRCHSGDCYGDNLQIRKCTNLPSCDSNDINSREEVTEPDPYVPEAEYDLEPETYPEYPPDVEEFYVESAAKSPTHFDVKVTENLDRSAVGVCGPGYRYNDSTGGCDDIDECAIENNQCHSTQACKNYPGGYRCSCPPGYQAQAAGTRCLDINECTRGEHKCQFACVNTAGGYVCACPLRLRLHIDKHHCVPASRYREKYAETNEKSRVSGRGSN